MMAWSLGKRVNEQSFWVLSPTHGSVLLVTTEALGLAQGQIPPHSDPRISQRDSLTNLLCHDI